MNAHPSRRWLQAGVLTLWLGLAAGLVEGWVRLFQHFGQGRVLRLPLDIIWMAPVIDVACLAFVALLLLAVHRAWRGLMAPAAGAGILTAVAVVPLLWLIFPNMQRGVALLLAAGVGVQAGRVAGRARVQAFVGRSLPWLLGLVMLESALLAGGRLLREHRLVADRPPVEGKHPNVLLIVWDTVRELDLSAYGYDRPTTPELERLSAQGVRFARAMSAASWTLPSHATLFTGQWPYVVYRAHDRPIRSPTSPLASVLHQAGYATGAFTANVGYADAQHGFDLGFEHYEDYPPSLGTAIDYARLTEVLLTQNWVRNLIGFYNKFGRKHAGSVNREFLGWLDRQDRHRPFFVFLNYFDAHFPYLPDDSVARRFVRPTTGAYRMLHEPANDDPDEKIAWLRDNYDASIAEIDRATGRLLRELRRRGLADSTIVIITADHGEQFGEHGLPGHGNSVYPQLLHVPLVIRYPAGVPAAVTVNHVVSLRDIPRTVLALARVESADSLPGRSLSRFWTSATPAAPSLVFAEVAQGHGMHLDPHAIITDDFQFISPLSRKDSGGFYDMRSDPLALQDLSRDSAYQGDLERFRGLSDSLRKEYDGLYQSGAFER